MSAKFYLKSETEEYFYADMLQLTIPCKNLDILNENGLNIYEAILTKVKNNEFKDTIHHVKIEQERSGMWHANKDHPFYDTHIQNTGCAGTICSWNNRVASFINSKGEELTSSIIIMHTPTWVYTKSGSLYKIGVEPVSD